MKSPLKILIADDEPVGRELIEAILIPEGYALNIVSNGSEALESALHDHPDLILLDVMMPGMDGFEVCKRIRANELTEYIPIFLITALDDRDSRIQGIEAGADDYISKPFDRIEILGKIKNKTRQIQHHKKTLNAGKSDQIEVHDNNKNLSQLNRSLILKMLHKPAFNENINFYTKSDGDFSRHAFVHKAKAGQDHFLFCSNILNPLEAAVANALLVQEWTDILLSGADPFDAMQTFVSVTARLNKEDMPDYQYVWICRSDDGLILSGKDQQALATDNEGSTKTFRLHKLKQDLELRLPVPNHILLLSPSCFEEARTDTLMKWLNETQPDLKDPESFESLYSEIGTTDDQLIVSLNF